jgi:hypothetical protein
MRRLFLKIFLAVIVIFVAIAFLQEVGIIPKRCDEIPDYRSDKERQIQNPAPGIRCYGIWHPYFWVKPSYI